MSAEFANVTIGQMLGLVSAILIAAGLCFTCHRWFVRWQRRRRWSRARTAELAAAGLLEQHGYAVMGAQVQASYSLVVDGQPEEISLRADYIVERAGRYYVAEVKSGRVAPRLDTAATRRQLLEYLIAFKVDGVLLVDGEARQVHQIEFPVTKGRARGASAIGSGVLLLAGLLLVAVIWIVIVH